MLCVDEFGPLNLQPRPGHGWFRRGQPARLRATYNRTHGVRQMFAALDLASGQAPVPRDSGRVRGNLHRPKRYHRGLRSVFYMAALSAIKRPDGPSRVFYLRKRGEGKLHTQALIALARRMVDVIWALLRDGREFHHSPPIAAQAA